MQQRGLHVRGHDGDWVARLQATDDPRTIGPVDFVILTVKAHQLAAIAPSLSSLLAPDTAVVTVQNGIPWWYFQRHGGSLDGAPLELLDPGGVIAGALAPERIVGCVAYQAATIPEPGVVQSTMKPRWVIGELDAPTSVRCERLAALFASAGLECTVHPRIRAEIWTKLLGNIALGPISCLTGATVGQIVNHPDSAQLMRAMIEETKATARALGVDVAMTADERLAVARRFGEHKPSMLQDLEAGKPIELDAIIGAVLHLADRVGVAMPCTRAVHACTRLLVSRR